MSDEAPAERKKRIISDDEEDEDVPATTAGEPAEQGDAIDDLFGDDDDHDDEDEPQQDNSADEKRVDDDDDDIFGDGGEGNDANGKEFIVQPAVEDEKELKVGNEEIIRHPPKFDNKGGVIYDAKIPKFLHVNATRFDGHDYLKNLEQEAANKSKDDIELQRLIDENTIRWRFTKQSNETLKAESNAQFIEWEDGSFSLKLGDEIFDVLDSELPDTYLTSQTNLEDSDSMSRVHLVDGVLSKTLKFVPTSTKSSIHKKLTSSIQSRNQTKPGAQSVFVDVDPEKEARRLEKAVEEKARERRRQQLKAEKEQERLGSPGISSQSGSRFSREHGYSRVREEVYDEEDGFIDDDDEEDEDVDLEDIDEDAGDDADEDDLAAERLRRIKDDGAAQYEEEEVSRKKRRVISDDEDDE